MTTVPTMLARQSSTSLSQPRVAWVCTASFPPTLWSLRWSLTIRGARSASGQTSWAGCTSRSADSCARPVYEIQRSKASALTGCCACRSTRGEGRCVDEGQPRGLGERGLPPTREDAPLSLLLPTTGVEQTRFLRIVLVLSPPECSNRMRHAVENGGLIARSSISGTYGLRSQSHREHTESDDGRTRSRGAQTALGKAPPRPAPHAPRAQRRTPVPSSSPPEERRIPHGPTCICKRCRFARARQLQNSERPRVQRVWSDETAAHIAALLAGGWTQQQIAEAADVSTGAVSMSKRPGRAIDVSTAENIAAVH